MYMYMFYRLCKSIVQHVTLFEVLQELDVNGKDLERIKNLFWQQQASVSIGQDMSD